MKPTTRDTGLIGAGKGDACRITDRKSYRANWDLIDWKRENTKPAFEISSKCDELPKGETTT